MQKIAQKRESRLRKLLTTDLGDYFEGKGFEKASPEFSQVVQEMNDTDEKVRAVATGDGKESLKDLLKQIKSNINRREYMKAIALLGKFHKKMYDINLLLGLFAKNIDKTHEKFLFHGLDDDTQQHLKSFRDKWASAHPYFIKQANILDFFHNLTNERGRALAGWEKRYPIKVKKVKDGAISALLAAEKMLSVLLVNFKLMDKARTVRNPDNYILASRKILEHFKSPYDRDFKIFYDTEIKGLLEQQDFFKTVVPGAPDSGGVGFVPPGQMPDDTTKTIQTPVQSIIPQLPKVPSMPVAPKYDQQIDNDTGEITYVDKKTRLEVPTNNISTPKPPIFDPKARVLNGPPPIARIAPPMPPPPKLRIAFEHDKFYKSLETMAEEAPIVLVSHIIKYAKSILKSDPETGIRLFKIAKSMKE